MESNTKANEPQSVPKPPKNLHPRIQEIWREVLPSFTGRVQFTPVFLRTFEAWCRVAYRMEVTGDTVDKLPPDGLMPGARGRQQAHPAFTNFDKAVARVVSIGEKLEQSAAKPEEGSDGWEEF
jgi:phage terminase small subunit